MLPPWHITLEFHVCFYHLSYGECSSVAIGSFILVCKFVQSIYWQPLYPCKQQPCWFPVCEWRRCEEECVSLCVCVFYHLASDYYFRVWVENNASALYVGRSQRQLEFICILMQVQIIPNMIICLVDRKGNCTIHELQ